ncbi:hypothetical protein DFA_01720 [Cavenderia fasciculata]|uniref:Ankyrin repeat-containing protein n=1 Tax=Cavenderia fasciculata TaxID=261658 RepID=F4PUB9_CACFS|nr:uncharacterized protein DFA_01720 [Cavenderia fasciculata]EGG21834.1 hypothetical protein DFA_01720 [Cavenderia fasciculata]|eukprot:XP_004359684.1 hypothetical protein DFA_01720 [Cavenderia fasciculata]
MITTFNSVFKILYIRQSIFNHVEKISQQQQQQQQTTGSKRHLKGRDIAKLPFLGMITDYGMPWYFIKHYLPPSDTLLFKRRAYTITRYCAHRNATLDILIHLLEWCPNYDPQQDKICYTRLAENIAATGNKDILEYIINRYPNINLNNVNQRAITGGHVSILELLTSLGKDGGDFTSDSLHRAIEYGYLNAVIYLHDRTKEKSNNSPPIFGNWAMGVAARNGHLDIVKFLHYNRTEGCVVDGLSLAARGGHLDIVKFLLLNRSDVSKYDVLTSAARSGNLELVKFLHEYNQFQFNCNTEAMDIAAASGHFSVVEWLHFNRTEGCTTRAMDQSPCFEITQFLHLNRTEGCTTKALNNASILGYVDTTNFLLNNRTEGCTIDALERTAFATNIVDIITYLHANDTHFSPRYVYYTIAWGRLDAIPFFLEHYIHSPIWDEALDMAAEFGYFDIVKVPTNPSIYSLINQMKPRY